MKKAKLRETIRERGISIRSISTHLKINPSTYYRKINEDGLTFTIKEVMAMQKILKMTTPQTIDIFFSKDSADAQYTNENL